MTEKQDMTILLANPRGFCAGVDRAIQIVEKALEKYGAPVYVRHEIVHNKYVVESLRQKGAVFVETLDEIPEKDIANDAPVIFSAHGVPKRVPAEAEKRNMFYIDATCPLVSKVHKEAERHFAKGHHIILIGHSGHPEVEGTMGQLPPGAVTLVETVDDVRRLVIDSDEKLAFCTQTTLSVDDTAEIVEALQNEFPNIIGPGKEDICYATTNRQKAVKEIAMECDAIMVIGAPNSSNSNRLVEVAKSYDCPKALMVQRGSDIDWDWLKGVRTLGLTAGASAPEVLVEEVIKTIEEKYTVKVETHTTTEENVIFNIPRILREQEKNKA
ncbi:MAG: 4-hydroxy-3-methylbut-2-enyl diphosphate reductase [Pseudomonadota bacterium]